MEDISKLCDLCDKVKEYIRKPFSIINASKVVMTVSAIALVIMWFLKWTGFIEYCTILDGFMLSDVAQKGLRDMGSLMIVLFVLACLLKLFGIRDKIIACDDLISDGKNRVFYPFCMTLFEFFNIIFSVYVLIETINIYLLCFNNVDYIFADTLVFWWAVLYVFLRLFVVMFMDNKSLWDKINEGMKDYNTRTDYCDINGKRLHFENSVLYHHKMYRVVRSSTNKKEVYLSDNVDNTVARDGDTSIIELKELVDRSDYDLIIVPSWYGEYN